MDSSVILTLLCIGLFAGILSGFIGVGGGIIIVPALMYFMGLTQFEAQGTSLALMLPPIGILAAYNYHQAGVMNWKFAGIIAVAFIIGGFFGSRLSLKMDELLVKFIFGIIMLFVAIKMIVGGFEFFQDKQ